MKSRKSLANILTASAVGIGSVFGIYPSVSFDEGSYRPRVQFDNMQKAEAVTRYGVEKKDAKYANPAYIEYSKALTESKYYKELTKLKENDTRKDRVLSQLLTSVNKALVESAAKGGYDIVVDKGDKGSDKYTDITAKVIKKLQENEK
ncbi:hypothetical protein HYW74_01140 [Candidatus Pacearchaeota archaeon]|nr:hypothetical protein [Candidatus Pacearchaeota archaeon]MBI4156872.1 hypothetical protein [Candidatus Woesearchaeota archaeon]